ncbi:MAG: pilus assembly protein PilM [Thermanaeromonas sp.]|uniref:type IV pilus biogenesis protein PilM n=1 Tax=Thermanaeromonas sp. TaxID=2003697 RepID=UPI00243C1809|nr:pilus assembly protein PilM [Thermanaeromonas sp.]MCG0277596.1 pilus assembly protein PilM [Thermanaeromonas sp.]
MFRILRRTDKSLLGVDLGSRLIKVVALKGRRVVAQGMREAPPAGVVDETQMTAALVDVVQQSGFKGRKAVSAIDGERVIVRYLRLPRMPEQELRSGLEYEAERYLPVSTQDMVLDCAILDPEPTGFAGQMLVMLAAAPRELAFSYYRIFRAAGLELVALDLVPAALCRALARQINEEAIVLELGANSAQVILVRGGQLLYSRRINAGIATVSPEDTPQGFNPLFNLLQEIRRSLEFYRSQVGREFSPSKVYLTGGGSYQEGLKDFLEIQLELPVEMGSTYGLGPEFAVAVGLALRES